ncbi:MAG: DEAD/DEAH box helicase [Actinomycetia bacterium]|nr:DEAD/DEAH box helicase [Actinomycetes bacterium]
MSEAARREGGEPEPGSGLTGAVPAWLMEISDADLERECGAGAFARGAAYARDGHVVAVSVADRGRMILGEVRGNRAAPYSTLVTHLENVPRGPSWVARCNCPVAVRCKHAVALLLHVRAAGTGPPRPWHDVLGAVLPDSGTAAMGTSKLGLGVILEQRPRSAADRAPVTSVCLVPRRESRVQTWITTVSWAELVGARSAAVQPSHAAVARRLLKLATGKETPVYAVTPRGLDLGTAGPGVWSVLAAARRAGVELQGANPGEAVTLTDPVDVVCDVWSEADRSARLAFAVVGHPVLERVVPIGDPVHGLLLTTADGPLLAPVRTPVPEWVGDMLVSGTTLEIPESDIEGLVENYLPGLATVVDIRDLDGTLRRFTEEDEVAAAAVTTGPFIHILLSPTGHLALDVVATVAYLRGGGDLHRFAAHTGWDAMRDYDAEEELIARLDILDAIPGLTRRNRTGRRVLPGRTTVSGADVVEVLALIRPQLDDEPDVIVQEASTLPAFEEADGAAEVDVVPIEEVRDWLSLQLIVTVDGEEVPFADLFAALVRGDEIMVLPSGVWFRLDQPQLQALKDLIEESKDLRDPDRPSVMRVHRHRVADIHDLVDLSVRDLAAQSWVESARRLTELTGDVDGGEAALTIAPPEGLLAELRPYQQAGYAWLSHLLDAGLGGILADDMGLGKTLQTLAAVLRRKEQGRLEQPVLVVAPTSVVSTWAQEAARFTPGLSVVALTETVRKSKKPLAERIEGADIVVTSYAVARLDIEHLRPQPWSVLICDEAQFVKNAAAKTHLALRSLDAESVVAITGTPMENSLMDLWALLSLTAPGLFPRADSFVKDYRRPIESGDAVMLARLRRRVRPLMLRRSKSVVAAELPEKQVQVVSVPMSSVHERIYQQHLQRERKRVLRLLDEDPEAHRVAILSSLTTLRQMSLHPGLVDEDYLEKTSAAKIDALIEQVRELAAEGHRALVFSSFTRFLRMVQDKLHLEGIETAYLDGSTTERDAVVRDFREGAAPVFLISLKAGGFGLTLIEADYVFVLDPWWNPAAEEQAIDRTHRIGQDKTVFVYRYVSADTIEEKVVALQEHKRDLFAKVVDKGGSLTGTISAEDIRALLD